MSKWKERMKRTRAFLTGDSEGAFIEGLESGFEGDYEQAIEYFDQVHYGILGTTERSLNAYFYKANALSELDKHDEAIPVYKKILKHEKDNPVVWNNLGYEYFEIKNYDEAKKCFEHAIKLDPDEPLFLSSNADVLFKLKENKKAMDVVDKALKLDSNYTDALFLKCDILIEMNRSEEVIKILDDLEYDEDIVTDIKELESIAYHELSNYSKALECVNEALKFEPNDESFWYNKACYLSLLGKQEEANDALLIATSIEPENINEIKNEKDFENIKNTERFQKLLNQSV
jgi:tetratricopeptide (TPR) repeat protein